MGERVGGTGQSARRGAAVGVSNRERSQWCEREHAIATVRTVQRDRTRWIDRQSTLAEERTQRWDRRGTRMRARMRTTVPGRPAVACDFRETLPCQGLAPRNRRGLVGQCDRISSAWRAVSVGDRSALCLSHSAWCSTWYLGTPTPIEIRTPMPKLSAVAMRTICLSSHIS